MALLPFYKQRKPRQFNHQPIYWDPRKEELQERERRIRRELGMEKMDEGYKPQIKGKFVEGTKHLRKSVEKGDDRRSREYKSFRLILILVVMGVILWILFFK